MLPQEGVLCRALREQEAEGQARPVTRTQVDLACRHTPARAPATSRLQTWRRLESGVVQTQAQPVRDAQGQAAAALARAGVQHSACARFVRAHQTSASAHPVFRSSCSTPATRICGADTRPHAQTQTSWRGRRRRARRLHARDALAKRRWVGGRSGEGARVSGRAGGHRARAAPLGHAPRLAVLGVEESDRNKGEERARCKADADEAHGPEIGYAVGTGPSGPSRRSVQTVCPDGLSRLPNT
eukprot:6193088-Pleurochrysis_carterae.AAC.5